MIGRYRVSINNIQLDTVDDRILIENVQYPEPNVSRAVATLGSRDGGIVTRRYRQKAEASITFSTNVYGTEERLDVIQKVIRWMNSGKVLRINDRNLTHLSHAIPEVYPAINVRDWTEPMTITFSDYVFPYWEDDEETVINIAAGTNKSGSITIPGSAEETYLNAEITAGASVTWIKVISGDYMIHLTNLSLSSGNVVTIDHDDEMNLRIRKGTTSLLEKRTAASSDDLMAKIGTNSINVQASGSVSSVIKARGCWM